MALLAHQQIQITGPAITLASATASDTVNPDDRLFLWYKNTDASARTITVDVPGSYFGQALTDVPVTLPATTGERLIGPIDRRLAAPATGLVTVTVTGTGAPAGVTVAAVKA